MAGKRRRRPYLKAEPTGFMWLVIGALALWPIINNIMTHR